MFRFSLALIFILFAQIIHAGQLDLTGQHTSVEEVDLNDSATLMTFVYDVPEWRKFDTIKIIEGCDHGRELHNASFRVSNRVRPKVHLINNRFIIGPEVDGALKWDWSWYFRNTGNTATNQWIEIRFTCHGHGDPGGRR